MKHSTFTLKWFCVVAAIFVACSSDSSSNASETDSSSSEFSGISSENLAESSSSQFSTLSSSESGDLDGDNPDVENTDTDTLSTSTWLSWEVPEAPSAGVYAAPDSAVLVTFSDAGISVLNAGTKSVSVSENILVIGSAGLYVMSGSCSDAQILINVPETATVELVLNGVKLHHSENAPLFFVAGDKMKIHLADGSTNIFSDARKYAFMTVGTYTELDSVPKACLYAREDLTIEGNGTLYVTGNYNNGIHTKADLVIKDSPTIYVNALNNALKGKGSVRVKDGGNYYLRTGDGSGISSDKATRPLDKGRVAISAGTFTMDVGNAGVKAAYVDSIAGGNFKIRTVNGDAFHAATLQVFDGNFEILAGDEGFCATEKLQLINGNAKITKSSKPFIGTQDLSVSGGTWVGLGGGRDSTMVPRNADIYAVVTILPTEIIEGSMVSIRNAEGSSVFSLEAGKNIQSLFAASPDFSAGIYTVYAGESAVCSFSWDSANKIATSCEAVQ